MELPGFFRELVRVGFLRAQMFDMELVKPQEIWQPWVDKGIVAYFALLNAPC